MKHFLIFLFFVLLSAVANANDSAVQICDNIHSTTKQIECLANIDYESEDTASIRMDHYNNNREKIKGAAIEFCRNEFPGSRSSDDCLNIVAPSRFIDAGAFNLCLEQSTSLRQIECLSKYGSPIDNEEDESVVIIIQNGQYIEQGSPECKYENFHGLYPEGGGCNFHGCWVAGGGCNFHGCWYPRGFCEFDGCINEAPKNNICK